jgi:hypothetical protein
MSRHHPGPVVVVIIGVIGVAACSYQSPVAPASPPAGASIEARPGGETGAPGTYEILFLKERDEPPYGHEPVLDGMLSVGERLVLSSRVTDSAGVLAEVGTVIYDYCDLHNEKAPSAACESGLGRWKRFMSVPVNELGALMYFGSCSTPRTIGFRVRFNGVSGPVASGVSAARDVSWQ